MIYIYIIICNLIIYIYVFFVVAVSSPLSIPKHSWQTMASHQRSSRYPKLLPTVVGLSQNRFAGLPQIPLVKHALPLKWQLKGVYSPFSDTQDTHVKLCSGSPPSMASITGNWTSRRPGRLPNLTKFGTAARQMIVLLSFVLFSVCSQCLFTSQRLFNHIKWCYHLQAAVWKTTPGLLLYLHLLYPGWS